MKKISVLKILVLIVLVVRILYYFAQPDFSTDHLSQMATAQNFMDGHGFSFKYLHSDLNVVYNTHIQWPPLYPFVLSLITFVTGNMLISSFIIQIISLLLLLYIWKKIFDLFKDFVSDEAYYYFIILLMISTSLINNINTILVFSLPLLSASLYYLFLDLISDHIKAKNIFFASFFASLLFWTHYSFFFVSYFPAVVLFIAFYIRKDKAVLHASIKSFFISLIITLGVLLYNYLTSGFINYMDNPHLWDAGFFPEQLLLTDPFFVNAFFNTSYIYHYILKTEHNALLSVFLQIISFGILAAICILLLKLRKNTSLSFIKTSSLFLPFFAIIITTISFLLYFTLHYHEIPRPGWTHLGDPRYLSPVYLAVISIVILALFIKTDHINKKFLTFTKQIMLLIVFISLGINIFITAKEWGNYSFKTDNHINFLEDLQALYDNLKFEESLGKKAVFIDNEISVRSFRISQYAGASVIDAKEVSDIKNLPSSFVFFYILPVEEQIRNEDITISDWSKNFNLTKAGVVYNNLTLYKVEDKNNE